MRDQAFDTDDRNPIATQTFVKAAPFLAGPTHTLADLHAAPMFAYFITTPEAEHLLVHHPDLKRWWENIANRPSMATTAVP